MFTRSCFNPRTYIRYDISRFRPPYSFPCFNPRTYIRYDKRPWALIVFIFVFQSTYLYKVRHELGIRSKRQTGFNPRTYIRYDISRFRPPYSFPCFNPRTYIRYDKRPWALIVFIFVFQSTYLYKVRHELGIRSKRQTGFNPRTYIRYDAGPIMATPTAMVSIHVPI